MPQTDTDGPRRLRASDRAVSATVGTLLMVTVTVVLAAGAVTGLFEIAEIDTLARQAQNVIQCGRAVC